MSEPHAARPTAAPVRRASLHGAGAHWQLTLDLTAGTRAPAPARPPLRAAATSVHAAAAERRARAAAAAPPASRAAPRAPPLGPAAAIQPRAISRARGAHVSRPPAAPPAPPREPASARAAAHAPAGGALGVGLPVLRLGSGGRPASDARRQAELASARLVGLRRLQAAESASRDAAARLHAAAAGEGGAGSVPQGQPGRLGQGARLGPLRAPRAAAPAERAALAAMERAHAAALAAANATAAEPAARTGGSAAGADAERPSSGPWRAAQAAGPRAGLDDEPWHGGAAGGARSDAAWRRARGGGDGASRLALIDAREQALQQAHLHMQWHRRSAADEAAAEEEEAQLQLALALSRSLAEGGLAPAAPHAAASAASAASGQFAGLHASGQPGEGDELSYERLAALEDVRVGVPLGLLQAACPEMAFADAAAFRAAAAAGEMGDAGDCPVCLSELLPDDGVRLLPCMHVYHAGCIDGWLRLSRHCPTCKAELC